MEWRTCIQDPNYAVCEDGRVKRITPGKGTRIGRLLRASIRAGGYYRVTLSGRYFYVHQLVAYAFHGNPPTPEHEVAHRDGDKTHNHRLNVRWATPRENSADKVAHGTQTFGETHPTTRYLDGDIERIFDLRKNGLSHSKIGGHLGISRSHVSGILRGSKRLYAARPPQ